LEKWDSAALMAALLTWTMWLSLGLAQAQSQPLEKPAWTHHLDKGVIDTGEYRNIYRNLLNAGNSTASVTFISEDKLVAYELLYRPGKLSARNPKMPEQSSFILRFILFNLAEGTSQELGEVPTGPEWTVIHKVRGGWVMSMRDEVQFTDDNLQPKVQISLSAHLSTDIAVSPDGESILIDQWSAKGGRYTVYDAPSFTERLRWRTGAPGMGFKSISDEEVIAPTSKAIYTGRFGKNLEPLFSSCGAMNCWDAYFLNNSDVAVNGRNSFTILHNGNPALKEGLCKECWVSTKAVSSQDGLHAAIPITRRKRSNWMDSATKPIAEEVSVYDLKRFTKVFSIDVIPLPSHHYDLALSPSGDKLAILDDWDISVYKVRH
jgi:hypothetical protein